MEKKMPVLVAIVSKNGKTIKDIETDLLIGQFVDGCAIRTVQITPNSDGSYTLDTGLDNEKTAIMP